MTDLQLAIKRYYEIKRQIKELQDESSRIVDYMDMELIVRKYDPHVQHFDLGDGIVVDATPSIYQKVDTDRLDAIMNGNAEAQKYVDTFYYKAEVSKSKWNSLPDSVKAMFADAVSESTGKTQYKCKFYEDER